MVAIPWVVDNVESALTIALFSRSVVVLTLICAVVDPLLPASFNRCIESTRMIF